MMLPSLELFYAEAQRHCRNKSKIHRRKTESETGNSIFIVIFVEKWYLKYGDDSLTIFKVALEKD